MKNRLYLIIVLIVLCLILSICGTYACFSTRIESTEGKVTLVTDELKLIYTDTLGMNDLSIQPGWSVTKTFTVENTTNEEKYYKIVWKNLVNTFVNIDNLTITINSTNGGGKLSKSSVKSSSLPGNYDIISSIAIAGKTIQEYTVTFEYGNTIVDQSADIGKTFSGSIEIQALESEYQGLYLYEKILEDNPNVETRTDFSTTFTESNNGNTIYKASGQDGKDTYYFAGQVTNNYVKFADKYWRIVRINEDNSVRLIYAGTSADDTAAFIGTSQAYNSSYNNSSYVGYMYTISEQYGTGTNSSIKTVVDNWYTSNLSSYSGYISKTAIYCNDRTVASGYTWSATGSTTFYYAARERLYTNKTPTFVCSNANDRFTASTSTGNGKLTYPIGLITADEVVYAGGKYKTNNSSYYIAQNALSGASYWWTMSPHNWNGSGNALVFNVGGSSFTGRLGSDSVSYTSGVRPVISLKACVIASGGSGTASDPYTVSLADGCANVENEILEENTVRVSATTNDTSLASVNAPSSVIINSGSSHTFTFTVKTGYEYESVSGCNGVFDTNTNQLTVSNVTSNTTCQVNFKSNNHTVNMNVSGGTISPTSATVSHGSSKTFTVTASTGYTTTGATVSCTNGVSGSISGSTVTVSNVTSNTTCTVTLPSKTYTVSATTNDTSMATVNAPASVSVNNGSSHTFTFTVKTGYEYESVSGCNGVFDTSTNKLTVSNVTSNTTCQVNFKAKTYTVNMNVSGGTISPTSATASHGSSKTFTVTASTGYTTTGATVSCTNGVSGSISGSTVTVSNVTSNTTCSVTLPLKTYTVSAAPNSTTYATVSAPSSVSVSHGGSYTFTFTVKTGYEYSSLSNCTGGSYNKSTNTLTVSNVTSNRSCTVNFKASTLYETILANNPNVETRTDFSSIFTTSNNGNTIYKASGQNGKTTYYFAGAVTNNYVKFANKYWRIVRINEDNSVRLIYAGTSATDTAGFIRLAAEYNTNYKNSSYVGYMYTVGEQHGTSTNSNVKTIVDNWYVSNLNSYDNYISKTAIYCNDRTVTEGSWFATGSEEMLYSAHTRFNKYAQPSYVCSNASDRFTVSTSTGNGKLTYPIGLITADEAYYAGGGFYNRNSNYYLVQNALNAEASWWTMTPDKYWIQGSGAYVFDIGVSEIGTIRSAGVYLDYFSVRPVISLKSCVTVSGGNGTASSPYTVSITTTCSSAEN